MSLFAIKRSSPFPHAIALSVLTWTLTVQEPGSVCPDHRTSCSFFIDSPKAYPDAGKFETLFQCLKAQQKYVKDFNAIVKEAGETVADTPETECVEQSGE